MTYIAAGCVALTGVILLFVAFIAWRNPVMFKTGLRNIPRRKAQTTLIIVGLMLSTVIITAAFGTGDTMTHSITNEVYTILGPVDEIVVWDTKLHPAAEDQQVIPLTDVQKLEDQFKDDPDIKGFMPYLRESLPMYNQRTRLNIGSAQITAAQPDDLQRIWGGLKDVDGKQVTLAANEIAVNESAAGKTDTKVGDTISIFYQGKPVGLTVKAILPNSMVSGSTNTVNRSGAAVNYDFLAGLTNRAGMANFVGVSNDGTTHGGVGASGKVTAKLKSALAGTNYTVEEAKKDNVESAQLVGNVFTTLFVVIGLFSIAAGVLLIFLIFIMLAAERKPEMGMARAVGAKRRQIVESFLAEGMGYDLGAALIGLVAGVGVAAAMVYFVKYGAADSPDFGLNLQFSVAARSLATAFCLGVITTFIVVFFASWRASRVNIVAAIRDLPESHPANPEAATVIGYLRGTLNGFVAFGFLTVGFIGLLHYQPLLPYFLLMLFGGIVGPWVGMVRNHNFGAPAGQRKQGDRLPVWPWILGGLTAILGVGVIVLVGYALAILTVRLTRERPPQSIPLWLVLAGILVPPLGVVLVSLQSRGRSIAWSVGVGVVGLVAGIMLVEWGVSAGKMFPFGLGVSIVALWAAVSLRYFHIHERLSFTVTSLVLLILWYLLPGGRLEWLTGKLTSGVEMFFLSGATLVTAGTFIVVYNADILLPLVARVGSRFGRLVPAIKTAVAYPLTSRFRTGLTIAMIGLIMFVLSMQSALNTNFAKAFSSDDALGGFDVRIQVNANNHTDQLVPAITQGNQGLPADQQADPAKIAATAEVRSASPFEINIKDPEAKFTDPAKEWKQYLILGVDDTFVENQKLPLEYRAAGYADDNAVWQAVKSGKNFAIIPAALTAGAQGFGPPTGIDQPLELERSRTKEGFAPFTLTMRDPGTKQETPITVIGQMKSTEGVFWPGIVISKQNLLSAFPESKGQEFFLKLQPGTNAKAYAKHVEAALIQASTDSLRQVIDDNLAINRTFLNMFQGFLALGLLVGIAALGVISFRAVVERRQQIGMLRAIGYQRKMVQLSFLLESGFIAVAGIALGLGLGVSFAWSLFTSGEVGSESKNIAFTVPWLQITGVTVFAFVASLIMTWLPARNASRVAVAEALRYE